MKKPISVPGPRRRRRYDEYRERFPSQGMKRLLARFPDAKKLVQCRVFDREGNVVCVEGAVEDGVGMSILRAALGARSCAMEAVAAAAKEEADKERRFTAPISAVLDLVVRQSYEVDMDREANASSFEPFAELLGHALSREEIDAYTAAIPIDQDPDAREDATAILQAFRARFCPATVAGP